VCLHFKLSQAHIVGSEHKKLKIKEHGDIHILQHPTKFEAKMLRREKL